VDALCAAGADTMIKGAKPLNMISIGFLHNGIQYILSSNNHGGVRFCRTSDRTRLSGERGRVGPPTLAQDNADRAREPPLPDGSPADRSHGVTQPGGVSVRSFTRLVR